MKSHKTTLSLIVLVIAILISWFLISDDAEKESMAKLPLQDEVAYSKKANQWISQMLIRQAQAKSKDEAENKKRSNAFWDRASDFSDAQLTKVEFYGRIVDQYGDPVPGVKVPYSAGGYYLASGSGAGFVMTDAEGIFVIDDAKGHSLHIRKPEKEGYKFKFYHEGPGAVRLEGFGHNPSKVWFTYTKEKPYVFKAWKVDDYPPSLISDNTLLGVHPDGRIYTVDFSKSGREILRKGEVSGDLRISMTRTERDWSLQIGVLDGGVQETKDFYLNLAPETGYQASIKYTAKDEEPKQQEREISILKRRLYFTSRNGEVYGRIKMEVEPYFNTKSAISFDYAVNMASDRNLTVKEKEIRR